MNWSLDDIRVSDLPLRFQEVAEIIGVPDALKLVSIWGGRRVYVPTGPRLRGSALHKALPELAELLALHFGGDHLAIPSLAHLGNRSRNRQIVCDRRAGLSASCLAEKYRLTERQVRSIIKLG